MTEDTTSNITPRPSWLPPRFIVLTDAGREGAPVYVHAELIVWLGRSEGVTYVKAVPGSNTLMVRESPEQIFAAITAATR